MRKNYVIIVAGGQGSRMQSSLPKQFLSIGEKPILMHTIQAFDLAGVNIILVLPQDHFSTWTSLCEQHAFHMPMQIVAGGSTRYHSVKNGLTLVKETASTDSRTKDNQCTYVAVHDAARPFVSPAAIQESFHQAKQYGSFVPSLPLTESLRQVTTAGNQAVDRAHYRSIQTPQIFPAETLLAAYNKPYQSTFTDDASVYEAAGHTIHLGQGWQENIKITTPQDLSWAEYWIAQNA